RTVVQGDVSLDGTDQAGDLFLSNLHCPRPALIGRPVLPGGLDKVRSADHEPRGLWTKQGFTAREDGKVDTDLGGVMPQVPYRRQLSGCIYDHWDVTGVGYGDDLF